MKLFFILACFGIIQALRFRDVFEVEYLLNIGKKTVIHQHCGSQKLDPKGTFFNDGENISNNFCKLSTEQKDQIRQRLSQIEKKWTIAKTTVCYGVTVEYPRFQISTLFDSMIQTGNGAAINGLTVSNDSNFWEYVQKGFGTGSKLMLGPAHLTYSLGSDIHSFITKNLKYSSTDLPPSDTLIRSLAMGKIKIVLSKLETRIDNTAFECLANKLHKEFYMLVYIFLAVISGFIFVIGIGWILYLKKCCNSST